MHASALARVLQSHARMRQLALALLTALAAAGCTDDSAACKKNQTQLCYCPGGAPSSQVCEADGTWGACACSPPDAPVITIPDAR